MAFGTFESWVRSHVDVKACCWKTTLMIQLKKLSKDSKILVCKLKKSIYELKQTLNNGISAFIM